MNRIISCICKIKYSKCSYYRKNKVLTIFFIYVFSSFLIILHYHIILLLIIINYIRFTQNGHNLLLCIQSDGNIKLIVVFCTWQNAFARLHFCERTRLRNCKVRQPVKRESTSSSSSFSSSYVYRFPIEFFANFL